MSENKKPFDGLKRPTVAMTKDEHKIIAHFCIDNDISIGEFLKSAGLYCAQKGINPIKK